VARANNQKYDWAEWFAKGVFRLQRGVHFSIAISTMAQSIRNAASKHGYHVRIQENGDMLTVRATKPVRQRVRREPINA